MSKYFKVAGLTTINEEWGEEPEDFCVQLHCELTSDGPGGEAFVVTVLSPVALARGLDGSERVDWGRGCLFMKDYSAPLIEAELQLFIDKSGADTWDALSQYVGKFFEWI